MRNQFVYTQKDPVPGKEGEFVSFRASFNMSKVIRSLTISDGRVLVLLDDIHQRPQDVEMRSHSGKVTGYKRQTNTFQSEIYLVDPEDIERFYKLTNIEE